MADVKAGLEFLERGVRMFFDVGLKFFWVELAPFAPTGFRGEGAGLDGLQIPINRTPSQLEPPGGFDLGAA